MTKFSGLIATISLLVGCTDVANLNDVSKAGDEANFGQAENQLFWTFEQKVAGFRNMEKIAWARYVPAGEDSYPLPREEKDLSGVTFTYANEEWSVEDYVQRQKVAGLILARYSITILRRRILSVPCCALLSATIYPRIYPKKSGSLSAWKVVHTGY